MGEHRVALVGAGRIARLHAENAAAHVPRLRFVAIADPAPGVASALAAEFGGRRDDGSAPYHPRKGSRSIAREAMQQLESLGLLSKTEKKGRSISAQGRKLLDSLSHEILLELAKTNPELAKYAGGA